MKYIFSFLTIAVLLMGCNSDLSSPKGTVTAFIEAMKKGDIEGSKKFLSKDDLAMWATAESFAKMMGKDAEITDAMKKEFIEKSKNVSYTVKDEKINGDKAEVNVEIKDHDSTTTQPFQLLKEDGSWKLSLMSTGLNMGGSHGNMSAGNINIGDSIKKAMDSLNSGYNKLQQMNADSINIKLKEGMQKIKEFEDKNPDATKRMEDAIKKMNEAAQKAKQ